MKRFDKTKSIEHNYYPIYANNMFTNVNIEDTVIVCVIYKDFVLVII